MEIHNLQDIEKALLETRGEFHKTTAPIRSLLNRAISLFTESIGLIRTVAKDTDDERHALEVLAAAFRRVMASIVLLESGLPQEAHMVLRNALELMLIAMDITYNKSSLEEWKKTIKDTLKEYDDWYFTKSKICKRIDKNERGMYPQLERELALHTGEEWKVISNKSLHAHSQAQIRQLFDSSGNFQLLGRKTVENYEKDLKLYQELIFDIVTLLIGIPKYRDLIGKTEALSVGRNRFAENYTKLKEELSAKGKMIEENSSKVSLLDSQDKEIGVSSEIRIVLDKLGAEAEAKAKVGADFEQVTRKMLQLLEANGLEVTKLKAIVTYSDTESGNKIENITIYYLD